MALRALSARLDPVTKKTLRSLLHQIVLRPIPSSLFCRLFLFYRCGYWPHLTQPRTFNEHVQRYKLTVRDAAMAFVADKYLLRDFVRSRVGARYLPRIIARWETAAEASCNGLPESFVVKASHGSGMNHIVRGAQLSDERLRALLIAWSKVNYHWKRREWVYRYLTPRFYAEEYLGDGRDVPNDYKAFVFNGRVALFQVDVDRFKDHRRALFDRDWNLLPIRYVYGPPLEMPKAPRALAEMIDVAERLGEEFIFARVDMYATGRRIVVGEITFYPEGGFGPFGSMEQDLIMGEHWLWPKGRVGV